MEDDGIGMDGPALHSLREKLKGNRNMEVKKKGGFGFEQCGPEDSYVLWRGADITVESEKDIGTCIKVYLGVTSAV